MTVRLHDPLAFRGRVELVPVTSEALRGNALGDPHERELPVYLPPNVDGPGDAELPVIFVLAAFTGRGQSQLETHPWKRGLVARYDAAVAAGEARPAILALPDCFTALGGSQYVNSSAVGRYEDHVADELVPLVDERYPTRRGARAVVGGSSGGFGALHLCMRRPGLFDAAASISGDVGFENVFGAEILACLRGLVAYEGLPERFLEAFREEPSLDGDGHAVINVLAMAACYSPNPDAPLGFDLPFDLATGERRDEVWQRWLAFDPLHAVAQHADALRALRLLYLECGLSDEFHLQWGLRRLVKRLAELDVPCVHEEHAGGHRGLARRVEPALDRLAAALA
ncbi:MAG: alpha/beta hydrolase-fold protein [Planctomycetota bacterium]